ncbi:MAG: PQQ-binding-like beta-propeller repeat protein [Planctomycetes bacterium]|nr:PQQ-binding-like beta-propeller repeat protein [Planctomycetota bacterium]
MVPIGTIGPGPKVADDDPGVAVQMFENPNLDNYLRRAQTFLDGADYVAAIEVLQDVIEGKTVEFLGGTATAEPTDDQASNGAADGGAATADAPQQERRRSPRELDAANSVFSQDSRLFRPVRRLCHELLSRMPEHGIDLYRTLYEVAADELLEAALASGSVSELEQVTNRYFATVAAGKAMVVLADRFMHEGRYRAAVQVLRDLVEIYPASNLKAAGADPVWCKFKIALCLRLAGETAVAQAAVRELAKEHAEDSLRILGELQSVRDFPEMGIFAADVMAMSEHLSDDGSQSWLGRETEGLVPLWQYRFVDPDPYRNPKSSKGDNNNTFWGGSQRVVSMPHADRYGPASWIRFVPGDRRGDPPAALFLDNFRLRVADARTGLLLREGDGDESPAAPRQGHPRIRIAAVDHALLRPVEDEARRYVIVGHERQTAANENVLKASTLIAYRRVGATHAGMERVWSSQDWEDGADGLRDVTFLAAPTVFGERLLLPALRHGAYALECVDRNTGRPLWHTLLHAEGSPFFKAPGSLVTVSGGTAYVTTNAGCVAAVDAFAGDLRWIRRYEREDPLRPTSRAKGNSQPEVNYGVEFMPGNITGFLPNDLIVSDGLVILAPCDGQMLLCLDGSSGQPVWMLDGQTHYAPYGKLETIVGTAASDLFVTSATALVCITLRGGLIKWCRELPATNGPKSIGRGRGAIVGDHVLIPGEREILVFDAKGIELMHRLLLPAFGVGPEPLQGPFNIVSNGPWLGVGYQGGVEVFSSKDALRAIAATSPDAWSSAGYLVSAGDFEAAEKVLTDWLTTRLPSASDRVRGSRRLLSLVRDRAMTLAANGRLAEAIAALDDIGPLCEERSVRLGWHLARIEVCSEGTDLRAHEDEQQRLYDFMEGKG